MVAVVSYSYKNRPKRVEIYISLTFCYLLNYPANYDDYEDSSNYILEVVGSAVKGACLYAEFVDKSPITCIDDVTSIGYITIKNAVETEVTEYYKTLSNFSNFELTFR